MLQMSVIKREGHSLMRTERIRLFYKGREGKINLLLSGFMLAAVVMLMMVCFDVSSAYAKTKIPQVKSGVDTNGYPWIVKSNGETIACVKDDNAADQILLGLKIKYCDSLAGQQQASVKNLVTVEKAPLGVYKKGDVLTAGQAVEKIAAMNKQAAAVEGAKAPVTIALSKVVEEDKAVKYKTKIVKTDEMVRGEKKVKVDGEYGSKHVISDVVMENGEYTDKTVLDSEITEKAVTKVVYEGTKLSTRDKGELLVQYATRFLGTKYVLGGADERKGIDCSGFTMRMYAKVGITMPHYSYDQEHIGKEVEYKDAQPGDLILYPGHVGMYMGNNMMIHATPGEVKITDDCRYRKITCVRRVFTDDDNVTQEMFDELFKDKYNEGAEEIAKAKLAQQDYYTMKNSADEDAAGNTGEMTDSQYDY